MTFLDRIVEKVLRLCGATRLDIELHRLEANIRRDEDRLKEMRDRAAGACCPGCFWGAVYSDLCDKQDRRAAWREVLLKRKGT